MSWIAWDKVLSNKKERGLDIGNLKAHNIALLDKWWWRCNSRKYELWKDVSRQYTGGMGVSMLRLEPKEKDLAGEV